ncbi:hypothetical protein GCM10007938_13140 [Vibrio zhanjiangensis]|uniref:Uncharacterized protein n=1 Tax=Vibrio zhanjiangensis TaxID=1046128 RepID=A0ABQ6EXW9_9VIBR|nr:hypothetical protein GCM10007938_13140 [Vibrio zhanjiangensis]
MYSSDLSMFKDKFINNKIRNIYSLVSSSNNIEYEKWSLEKAAIL